MQLSYKIFENSMNHKKSTAIHWPAELAINLSAIPKGQYLQKQRI